MGWAEGVSANMGESSGSAYLQRIPGRKTISSLVGEIKSPWRLGGDLDKLLEEKGGERWATIRVREEKKRTFALGKIIETKKKNRRAFAKKRMGQTSPS